MKRKTSCLLAEARRASLRSLLFFRMLAGVTLLASLGAAASTGLAAGLVLAAAGGGALWHLQNPAHVLGLARTANFINGFQGVAANATATLNIPVGRRYHSLRIFFTNAAGAAVNPVTVASNIKLIVNGIPMRDVSPAQCINLANTYRITPGVGEVPMFFTEPWRNDVRTAEATSWDTFGVGSFVLQVTFLNPGGGVGISAVLADYDGLRNETRNAQGARVPFLSIIKQFSINVNSPLGVSDIVTLPTNYPIQRIYLDVSANAISSLVVLTDNNYKQFEATKVQNQDLLNANLINGTFFEFPLVFDYDSKLSSNVRTSSLDLQITTTGAATVTCMMNQLVPGYV